MQLSECVWMRRSSFVAIVLMAMLCMCMFMVPESLAAENEQVGNDASAANVQIDAASGASEIPGTSGAAEISGVPEDGNVSEAGKVPEAAVPVTKEEVAETAVAQPGNEVAQADATKAETPAAELAAPEAFAQVDVTAAPAAEPALSAADDAASYEESHVNMYRLYNPNSGEHFYTSSLYEAQHVASVGWQWEGIGWVAPTANNRPVFRLYNPNAGDHHYTLSSYERDHLVSVGWNYEGIGWYSDSEDQAAVFRQYNPNARAGAHNFTTSSYEDSYLGQVGWNREGTAWYATDGANIAIEGFWLVTNAWGGLERYWIDSSANVAKSRFIETSEGSGWRAYATASGAVARDRYIQLDNYWYQTDSEGRLSDGDADRIISVSYLGGSAANLEMFAKDSSGWHSILSSSAILGTNGINKDHEGDRKTPTGTFDITEGFGILDNPGLSGIPYTKVHEYLWWSGAPDTYNTMVDSRYTDPGDGEHLIEYSPYYNYALVIGYNTERIYGKGSAIFLHCDTGRSSTAGCVGVSENVMVDIMRNTTAHTKICIY